MTVVLGVDVGGTKLRARLVDTVTILDLELPSRSWLANDPRTITGHMAALRDRLPTAPAVVCVGASGCETEADSRRIHAGLQPLWPAAHITVLNDAELILPAARVEVGTALVCGTGAIALATGPNGHTRRAGGWGPLLGDDGSAFHLVRSAARHVLGLADARRDPDPVTVTLQQVAGAATVPDLMHRLHAFEDPAGLAALAPAICALAETGDHIATRLIIEECEALVALAGQVNRGLEDAPIVCAGGLVERVPYFAQQLCAQLIERFPRSDVSILRDPPVCGAVHLAERVVADQIDGSAAPYAAAHTRAPGGPPGRGRNEV